MLSITGSNKTKRRTKKSQYSNSENTEYNRTIKRNRKHLTSTSSAETKKNKKQRTGNNNNNNNNNTNNNTISKRKRQKPIKYSPEQQRVIKKVKRQQPNEIYTKDSLEKMMYAIGDVFISNKNFSNKIKTINKLLFGTLGKKVRDVVTGGSTPDTECKKAKERANTIGYNTAPAINYKHNTERQKNEGAQSVTGNIQTHAWTKNKDGKQTLVKFKVEKIGYCGECWLCGLNVNYYSGFDEDGNGYVTSCGECEHIGAIIASFLTGMLTSADLDIMAYNYGSSHVHCNQRKSNTISMQFTTNGKWEYDKNGAGIIAGSIVDSPMHNTEYDTIFKNEFNGKMKKKDKFKKNIIANIEGVTGEWCRVANSSIVGVDKKKKIKGAKLAELAREITIELMKKTKKYQILIKGGIKSNIISVNSSSNSKWYDPMPIDKSKDNPDKTMLVSPDIHSDNSSSNSKWYDPMSIEIDKKIKENNAKPVLITPDTHSDDLMTDIDDKLKTIFGEDLLKRLIELHKLQTEIINEYREDLFLNLQKARQKSERFSELNKALEEFNK